jgi:tetrahydromethanopterin S-methyltransferase subunit H
MSLSDSIREAIKASDKPMLRISEETGIDSGILSRFVTDNLESRRDIRLETADKLAEYFGLKLVGPKKKAKK